MARFKIGGSGPNGRGLGWIEGITERRFDKAGEIYDTDRFGEIQFLRRCPYTEELADESITQPNGQSCNIGNERLREDLRKEKMKELIKIGRGLYRVGMTKAELIDMIVAESRISEYPYNSQESTA